MIAKFHGSEPWRCEDTKGIVAPEIGPWPELLEAWLALTSVDDHKKV